MFQVVLFLLLLSLPISFPIIFPKLPAWIKTPKDLGIFDRVWKAAIKWVCLPGRELKKLPRKGLIPRRQGFGSIILANDKRSTSERSDVETSGKGKKESGMP